MSGWLDWSTVVSTALGTVIAGALLLTSAPLWWRKWLDSVEAAKIKEAAKTLAVFGFLLALWLGASLLSAYFDSAPRHHPTLTEKEKRMAFSECEMESVKATSDISRRRDYAQIKYRNACLISKGFRHTSGSDRE